MASLSLISSENSDTFIPAAFKRLQGMYGECEADIIDRLAGGSVPYHDRLDTGNLRYRAYLLPVLDRTQGHGHSCLPLAVLLHSLDEV